MSRWWADSPGVMAISVHSGACGVPRSLPRSGAPPFNGAPPGESRFFSGVDRAFYGRDRIFYGRDGVFRTICELSAYFKLL